MTAGACRAPRRWSARARNARRSAASPAGSRCASAGRPRRLTRASRIVAGVSPGWMMRAAIPSVQADAETKQRRRFDVAVEPAAGGELIFDQPVGGSGIGHAQQRLGEDHQSEALLGRDRIGVQEILDAAEAAGSGANRLDETARAGIDAALGCSVTARFGEESRGNPRRAARTAPGMERAQGLSSSLSAPHRLRRRPY